MQADGGWPWLGGLARVVPGIAGRGVLHQQLTDGVLSCLCDWAHTGSRSQPWNLLKIKKIFLFYFCLSYAASIVLYRTSYPYLVRPCYINSLLHKDYCWHFESYQWSVLYKKKPEYCLEAKSPYREQDVILLLYEMCCYTTIGPATLGFTLCLWAQLGCPGPMEAARRGCVLDQVSSLKAWPPSNEMASSI